MIAVGSDRGCPGGTTYIVGSNPSCLGLIFIKKQAHLFIQLHTIFVLQRGKVSWHTHR